MSGASMMVASAGLCCSLGYQLDAAVWAMRANMDHFQESAFFCRNGHAIPVASLPDDVFGQERLQRWVDYAVSDCARGLPGLPALLDVDRTAVIVLGPHASRPHADQAVCRTLAQDAMARLAGGTEAPPAGQRTHRITVLMEGRAGLGSALQLAARYLASEEAAQVLLIGVDSYLSAADINAGLNERRLFVKDNSNGFMPGEAAAAVVLRRGRRGEAGMHVGGVGIAAEEGRYDGSVPSRAKGLTEAVRAACRQAQIDPGQLAFRASDQNGEQFYAREAANAMARVMFGKPRLAHLTIADKVGEVGAAAGTALLAWLWRDLADAEFSPGSNGIIHLAGDDGVRCAVALHYFGG
jgi:3-oxoacyl-[acyl-carrier-protein] synthase-1